MKKILHIIDGLPRGGAETLLVGTIQYLNNFEHIVISLTPRNDFIDELAHIQVITLAFKWYHSIPATVRRVKKIIKKQKPEVVHAHLFWSTIIARLAAPSHLKQLNSYHNVLYGHNGAGYPVHARLLDRATYKKHITTLCVSSEVAKDIEKYVGIKENVFVLYNFVENGFFENYRPAPEAKSPIKLVAVGNLKPQKNYGVILNAFKLLQQQGLEHLFSIDIFGQGDMLEGFQNTIQESNLSNIQFKGAVSNVATRLPHYDVYIISSIYEGFGIAVVEAMAVGLPVLVSDIGVLREITNGKAIFFDPKDPSALASRLKELCGGKYNLRQMSEQGFQQAQLYRKESYMTTLKNLYK